MTIISAYLGQQYNWSVAGGNVQREMSEYQSIFNIFYFNIR